MEEADLVLCMTAEHRDLVRRMYPGQADRVHRFREFLGLAPADLSDPFGGSLADYEFCAGQIAEALAELLVAQETP
jgi:protein-tyrosine phosphatase